MQIDWRLKSILFRVADLLPPSLLYAAQRYVSGSSVRPVSKISATWHFHAEQLKRHEAGTVLEIGAGKDLVQNLYLSSAGFQQTIIDLDPMVDMRLVSRAASNLRRLGINLTERPLRCVDDLRKYDITYLAPVDARQTPFEDQSFDAVISTNTLEHIDRESLVDIFHEWMRLLRAGGIVSAKIDYSDHYARTDRKIGNANFLRFTETQWQKHNHRHHYQNRLRHGHYAELARGCGFELIEQEAYCPHTTWPNDVRSETLTGHASDRMAAGFYMWRKPATP